MLYRFLILSPLALAACNQATPGDATASGVPSAPATMATTNAKVEPVPGLPSSAAPSGTPSAGETAMPASQPPATDAEECGAGKAARFVGRKATPDVRAGVAKAVGHDRIRWIGPGDAVTMDYSEGRLNADLDQGGKITGFRCG
jgi:hypothetical protein